MFRASSLIVLATSAHGLLISSRTTFAPNNIVRTSLTFMNTANPMVTEDAKRAWLNRLDTPVWGSKGVVTPIASDTNAKAQVSEDEAKKVWLARLEASRPTWGGAEKAAPKMSEDEAKKAWLAKLDAPTWGKAAAVVADIAKEASVMEAMTAECELGAIDTCDKLSREEEAKRKWLASLDVPGAWGAAAAAVSAVAAVSTEIANEEESAPSAEEIAKAKWLAKLDAPVWRSVMKAHTPTQEAIEEEAKKAWLAKLDAPSWKKAANAMVKVVEEASAIQHMTDACDQGDDVACESLSREEEAKKAWLARLDVPAWGAAAAAVSAVASKVRE